MSSAQETFSFFSTFGFEIRSTRLPLSKTQSLDLPVQATGPVRFRKMCNGWLEGNEGYYWPYVSSPWLLLGAREPVACLSEPLSPHTTDRWGSISCFFNTVQLIDFRSNAGHMCTQLPDASEEEPANDMTSACCLRRKKKKNKTKKKPSTEQLILKTFPVLPPGSQSMANLPARPPCCRTVVLSFQDRPT
jgi:hypothetical protein